VKLAKVPTSIANQAVGVVKASRRRVSAGRSRPHHPRHHGDHQCGAGAQGRQGRPRHHRRLPRHLELGRRTRPRAYGLFGTFEPLIERELRLEVPERMNVSGEVVVPLDEDAVEAAVRRLIALGCESLVIHFLHAYANPAHERRAGEIARALWPNDYVTLGHELLSEFREYERGTTAAVNAAVQPILDRYVRRLQSELSERGFQRDLLVMNGNGGTAPARHVSREAAKTVMSGPASGVIAAAATLAQSGLTNAITYDMGGTSTDVALIHGGMPEVSAELTIDYGLPIHLPMVDVRTVGAGGGSIASGEPRGDAAGRPRERRLRPPARSASAAAGCARPSPTPIWCSAASTRPA
jgi:N-methylhydantoinase A